VVTAGATPAVTITTAAPAPARNHLSAWRGCGGGFQCATLTVPMDPAKPSLGTIGLALTRHRATGSRVGALLVNPGGPGASAVGYLQDAYSGFPSALRSHFDLVAFDPRGVGRTAPVRCESATSLDAYFHLDPAPDSPAETAQFDAGNKTFARGCAARAARVLPYVSTKIVAQDMERVRQALGEAKLTYLGYSYGTSIGAAYLDAFPTHVRAMVLDGALDPTLTWDQLLAGQSRGFDVALGAFLADCEKTSCAFRQAVSGDLGHAYDALAASVETTELSGAGSRKVGPGEFSYGVGQALYSKTYWPYLGSALAKAENGDGSDLLALSDSYLERTASGYANTIEANNAVNCVDRPWPRTDAPYQALAKEVGKSYPRFGPAIALSGGVCEFWSVRPASTPHAVTGAGSPPIVVVGTTRDPATPYTWAQALARQLTKGILITHVGDGHTAYHGGASSCLTAPINAYLVSLKTPPALTC
jgi:pimeloyl-ACP methyl ester carboxylesterase